MNSEEKGHNKLFQESLDRAGKALAKAGSIYTNGTSSSPEFRALEEITAICNRNGIDLVVFVHPYHRTLINMIEKLNSETILSNLIAHRYKCEVLL